MWYPGTISGPEYHARFRADQPDLVQDRLRMHWPGYTFDGGVVHREIQVANRFIHDADPGLLHKVGERSRFART